MSTKRYPDHLEAVDQLVNMSPDDFISDDDLAAVLNTAVGSAKFGLDMMKIREILTWEHNIVLLRDHRNGVSGLKIATEEDKVQVYIPRQDRKMRNTARRQQHVAVNVDRDVLTPGSQRRLDHQVAVSGLQVAFQSQVHRRNLTSKMILQVPPALVPGKSDTETPMETLDDET